LLRGRQHIVVLVGRADYAEGNASTWVKSYARKVIT